jgi:hypothetical protein
MMSLMLTVKKPTRFVRCAPEILSYLIHRAICDQKTPRAGALASVLSAILAILLAMSLGFSAVLLIAIGLYLVAAASFANRDVGLCCHLGKSRLELGSSRTPMRRQRHRTR